MREGCYPQFMEKCRIVPTRLWSARKRQLINLVSEGQLQAWQLPYFTTNSVSGQPLSIFYEKLHKSAAIFLPLRAETALGAEVALAHHPHGSQVC